MWTPYLFRSVQGLLRGEVDYGCGGEFLRDYFGGEVEPAFTAIQDNTITTCDNLVGPDQNSIGTKNKLNVPVPIVPASKLANQCFQSATI
jgi:hypothetical protein